MRFYEISSGFRIPMSLEEEEIMDFITSSEDKVNEETLDERQQEVARKMVSRSLLNRRKDGEEYILTPNDLNDIWRDTK